MYSKCHPKHILQAQVQRISSINSLQHIIEAETQLKGVTTLDHGQQSEPAATEHYTSTMQRGHSGLNVFHGGLCLHPRPRVYCS